MVENWEMIRLGVPIICSGIVVWIQICSNRKIEKVKGEIAKAEFLFSAHKQRQIEALEYIYEMLSKLLPVTNDVSDILIDNKSVSSLKTNEIKLLKNWVVLYGYFHSRIREKKYILPSNLKALYEEKHQIFYGLRSYIRYTLKMYDCFEFYDYGTEEVYDLASDDYYDYEKNRTKIDEAFLKESVSLNEELRKYIDDYFEKLE